MNLKGSYSADDSDTESEYDALDLLEPPRDVTPEKQMVPAASLIASRTNFWEVHRRFEDVTSADNVQISVATDDDAADVKPLDVATFVPTISLVHPGREVFCSTDSPSDLDTVALVYDFCTRNCTSGSSFVEHLNLCGTDNFRAIIYNRTSSMFNACTEADLKVVAANIMILMAITNDEEICDSCYDLLLQFLGRWRPTLGDILNTFRFWGILVAVLIPPEFGDATNFQLYETPPRFVPREHNIAQVLQYLTHLFNEESVFSDFGRVGIIFRIVLLIQLDVSLTRWNNFHLSQSCLSSLLKQISADEWTEREKLVQLCRSVHFSEELYHNQAFLCNLLRDSSSRCQDISSYLSWRLVHQMAAANEVDEEEVGVVTLVKFLHEHKAVILNLDLQQKLVFLMVLRSLVSSLNISASDMTELKQLIEFVHSCDSSVPQGVASPDNNRVRNYISLMDFQLLALKNELALNILNDSQPTPQPTPVK